MIREECLRNAGKQELCVIIPVFLLSLAIWTKILVEPRDGLLESVGLVLWFDEKMAFAGIHDQFGRHAERF